MKIKEVRDDLLLEKIQNILENHENQQSLLEGELTAQLASDVNVSVSLDESWVRNEIQEAILNAFFPEGLIGASALELEFYEAHKDFLYYMTLSYLKESGYLPLSDRLDAAAPEEVIESYVIEKVDEILDKVRTAEEAEQTLTDVLKPLEIDPDLLTSIDAISGNTELTEAILSVPDITNLIEGHSDTLVLEVWNPGDRSEPIYRKTIQTDLFGEGAVTLSDFTTGAYDFTVYRDYTRRRALSGISVRTQTLFLDFTEDELKWGDFDNDLQINLEDIRALPDVFKADPKATDINEDGAFDLMDIGEMLQGWGG